MGVSSYYKIAAGGTPRHICIALKLLSAQVVVIFIRLTENVTRLLMQRRIYLL